MRKPAVPVGLSDAITVLGNPAIRTPSNRFSQPFHDELVRNGRREFEQHLQQGDARSWPRANFLALSGGGPNGAYGAGIICGWTASGTRPEFNIVTGVSTGALIAPFAFLGPDYDHKLRETYTSVTTSQVIQRRSFLAFFFDDALFDSSPLRRLVELMVDQQVVDAIAAEHSRGRLLFVATTNLDANTGVFWNVTAIAASGHPESLELIHDVLIASASIPGAFPPVMIDVEVDGRKYQEMHVDGATKSQVFLFPAWVDLDAHDAALGIQRERAAFVIRNGRMEPEWEDVPRQTQAILGRAIEALIRSQGIGDIFRIYVLARREGVDFNLAFIPNSFQAQSSELFDPAFMTTLFELGYEAAAAPGGYPWAKVVPGFEDRGAILFETQTEP